MKTLTGLTLEQAQARLDEVLPAEAYSAVPGRTELTDIDPNYMRAVLSSTFGMCGYGWGYEYDPANMELHRETREFQSGTRDVMVAVLKRLRFWYKLKDGDNVITCSLDASGGSENSSYAYAMKGAITNALGNAASNIGFQQSVYLGKRSHKTVRAEKPAAAARPAQPIEELDPGDDPGGYVIPLGKRKGQKLGDQPLDVIRWYAEKMAADDPSKKDLQEAARAYLKANGRVTAA